MRSSDIQRYFTRSAPRGRGGSPIRPVRVIAIVLAALVAAPFALAQEPDEAEATVCPGGVQWMEGVGQVCSRSDGLYEVFDDDMVSLGFIHGTDPVFAEDEAPLEVDGGTSPLCVSGAPGTYYAQVIYARASNDADNYLSMRSTIRSLVGSANAHVDNAASATGSRADIRVKCVSGLVEVKDVVLPTSYGSATFSNIVSDLRDAGYDDPKVKYWVYYDQQISCGCSGTGHLYSDDRLSLSNYNNGNGASMFAVTFGYNSVRTWLHELGHTLGAVQNSAPYSTGAGHCYDGRDIMCYNDGGPRGYLYSTGYCGSEIFDCGKNTYFHANPSSGSYLATHWNLGSRLNRFFSITGGDDIPPTLTVRDPGASSVRDGCTNGVVRVPLFVVGARFDPILVNNGCVTGSANDAQSGLRAVEVFLNGDLVASTTRSPFQLEFGLDETDLDAKLLVVATDNNWNVASVELAVMTVAPR